MTGSIAFLRRQINRPEYLAVLVAFAILSFIAGAVSARSHPQPNLRPRSALERRIDAIIDPMTAEQKVAQLFVVSVESYRTGAASRYPPGGVIYAASDLQPYQPDYIAQKSMRLQHTAAKYGAHLPLFVVIDQE